jgi:1,2-diacylglycerol 3-beta-galactosyltransferase
VVVGKPGPGVVSEALVLGIPVVVLDHPDHTPPQERSVAAWVKEHGVGVVIQSLDELEGALAPARLGACARHRNTAYTEVLEILTMVASR